MQIVYLFTTTRKTFAPRQLTEAKLMIEKTYPHCDVFIDHLNHQGSLTISSSANTPALMTTFAIGVNVGRILQIHNIV